MVDFSTNLVENEIKILKWWDENKIYEKLMESRKDNSLFSFLDGPPFVNGTPHCGHVLVSYIKDTVLRHYSSRGYHVPRTIGFDCHGLPLEKEAEKIININTKKEIEDYGIDKYNDVCRNIIKNCSNIWKQTLERMGRWSDWDNTYYTSSEKFMKTEWWAFKKLWDKNLIYYGKKVMPYSPLCTTVLSNFEANLNYKDIISPSVFVEVKLNSGKYKGNYIIIWTTTPWTLPANLAIAVNPNIYYILVKDHESNKNYIFAENLLFNIWKKEKQEIELLNNFKGTELIGSKYIPIFSFFNKTHFYSNKHYIIIGADFVKEDNGTGLVHLAPSFGEDDYNTCVHEGIISKKGEGSICPVNSNCFFDNPMPEHFHNRFVIDCNRDIINLLKNNNKLFKEKNYKHSYPHCWRTDKPLIYMAVNSWFINVISLKDKLIENNNKIKWVPEHIGKHRFGDWLHNARDWCISRSRFWGTPIPIWISDDGEEIICIENKQQLEDIIGYKINDLHREFIDNIEIDSKEGRGKLKRIPDVFDCWFESGLCGIARWGYPECSKNLPIYPIDFISESLDQTRGWFYTLNVLSTALFDSPAFKNVIVSGLILASDGKKMSKRLNNYTNPMELISKFGSDPLRMYLISTPASKAKEFSFQDKRVKEVVKKILPFIHGNKLLLEVYHKYIIKWGELNLNINSDDTMDCWIKIRLKSLHNFIWDEMNNLRIYNIGNEIYKFIEDLTNWYIKLNRYRLKGQISTNNLLNKTESEKSIATLYQVIYQLLPLISSFMPFLSEYLWKIFGIFNNNQGESVHLEIIKEPNKMKHIEIEIERKFYLFQKLIENLRKYREILNKKYNIGYNTPLKNIIISHKSKQILDNIYDLEFYLKKEINVLNISYHSSDNYLIEEMEPHMGTIGKIYKKDSKKVFELLQNANLENISELKWNNNPISETCYRIKSTLNIPENYIGNCINVLSHNNVISGLCFFLNYQINDDCISIGWMNQLRKQIQSKRKDAGIKCWDNINIWIKVDDNKYYKILENHLNLLEKELSAKINLTSNLPENQNKYNIDFNINIVFEKVKLYQ